MVERIEKALRKLSGKEQRAIKSMLKRIKSGSIEGLDIKKLKGNTKIYRVRKGSIRIIYSLENSKNIKILAVERKSDTTYGRY